MSNNTKNESPAAILDALDELETFARILGSQEIAAALARYDGKRIDARLWRELSRVADELAGPNRSATVQPPRVVAGASVDLFRLRVQKWRDNRGGKIVAGAWSRDVYGRGGPVGPDGATTPGARLDADKVSRRLAAEAKELRDEAGQLRAEIDGFGKILELLREIGSKADALCRYYRPEWRYCLGSTAGSALYVVSKLRDADASSFLPL